MAQRLVRVVHADRAVVAVSKPLGMLSQADGSGGPCALEWTREWIRKDRNKPGKAFAGLVHRLDRGTSGLFLVACTSRAASKLSAAFRNRMIHKEYWTVVHGRMESHRGTLRHAFARQTKVQKVRGPSRTRVLYRLDERALPGGSDGRSMTDTVGAREAEQTWQSGEGGVREPFESVRAGEVEAGAAEQLAELRWRVRGEWSDRDGHKSLLQVHLLTGRRHQIRAQLSHVGCPVVGDVLYGGRQCHRSADLLFMEVGGVALHSAHVSTLHPSPGLPPLDLSDPHVPIQWKRSFGIESLPGSLIL